jgi:peptidyl-dipeptidase Dcp
LTAAAFRHLLESGNTVEPELLYRTFRGRDPKIEALMRRDGILH